MAPARPMNKKYVTGKVNTVRWRPSNSGHEDSHIFVTGTWGDQEVNNISVWELKTGEKDPELIQETLTNVDVNSIEYVSNDLFVAGMGNGSVGLWHHDSENLIHEKHVWTKNHCVKTGSVPCTRVATHRGTVGSVGEDGKLIIYEPSTEKLIQTIDSADGSHEYAIAFVQSTQVLTGGMQGHLRLWDLRSPAQAQATLMSPDYVSVRDLRRHPTQPHIVAAAGQGGVLSIWDMRSTSQPFSLISAHTGPISELQFHPSNTNRLFSCGLDGKVVEWSANTNKSGTIAQSQSNMWLSDEVACGDVQATSLIPSSILPTNALAIESQTLLVGSDNEAVYIVENVYN